jgi:hypothetical protein
MAILLLVMPKTWFNEFGTNHLFQVNELLRAKTPICTPTLKNPLKSDKVELQNQKVFKNSDLPLVVMTFTLAMTNPT